LIGAKDKDGIFLSMLHLARCHMPFPKCSPAVYMWHAEFMIQRLWVWGSMASSTCEWRTCSRSLRKI